MQGDDDDDEVSFDDETTIRTDRAEEAKPKAAPASIEDDKPEEWGVGTDLIAPEAQARLKQAPALPFQPTAGLATFEDDKPEEWEVGTELIAPEAQARLTNAPALPFQSAPTPPSYAPAPPPVDVLAHVPFRPARREPVAAPVEPETPAVPARPPVPPRRTDGIPIVHDTRFSITTLPWVHGRRDMRSVIVKATCDLLPGEAARLREEAELPTGDIHHDDDPEKSLVHGSDLVPHKPKVDVTLVGHAYAQAGATAAVVRLRFGDPQAGGFERRVAVFGERRFERVMGALVGPEKPAPFQAVPLVYERAFGGAGSPDNPVGIGRDGKAAPQLEDADRLVRSPRDVIPPACLGPIAPRWPVRASKLGTFDASWLKDRWPSLPADLDATYWQAAPLPQQIEAARGDEAFVLAGVHPTIAVLEGRLPGARARGFADRNGELVEVALRLDTVAFDADGMKVDLVFRGVMEVADEDASDVAAVFVMMEPVAGPVLTIDEVKARYEARRVELGVVPEEPAAPAANDVAPDRFAARERQIQAGLAALGVASLGAEAAAAAATNPAETNPEPDAADKAAAPRRKVVALLASGKPLAGLDLAEADLSGLDLSGQTLVKTNLRGALLRGVSLEGADLSEAQLSEAVLSGARAAGVKLSRADLTGATLDGAELSGAELDDASLEGSRCDGAIFRGARGERARFAGSLLRGAVFDRAELPAADFTGAVLDRARFAGARMREARFYDVSGEGVVFDDADLEGARADAMRLAGASFARIAAPRSVWDASTLTNAFFAGARLPGASFARALCEGASFAGADLTNGNLRKACLAGASFEEANLMQASLESADLTGAVLRGANLYGAETWKAKIDKADLARALLGKTKLEGQA